MRTKAYREPSLVKVIDIVREDTVLLNRGLYEVKLLLNNLWILL
jgi:hypothetical protein